MTLLPLPILILEILVFTTGLHFYDFWDVFWAYTLPSVLGLMLFSMMGRSMLVGLQAGLQPGQLPADRVLHQVARIVGCVCLIVPLFSTRVLAVFLLLPGLRHLSLIFFKNFIFKRMSKVPFSFVRFGGNGSGFQRGPFGEEPRHERDAEVVNVTPIEITHTKIKEDKN
jgi:UPF0716 family protein affecting phage T7 exclusion